MKRFIPVDNGPEGMSGSWDFEILKADYEIPELDNIGFDFIGNTDVIFSNDLNDRSKGRMSRNDGQTEVVAIGRFIGACDAEIVSRVCNKLQQNEDSSEMALMVCNILDREL